MSCSELVDSRLLGGAALLCAGPRLGALRPRRRGRRARRLSAAQQRYLALAEPASRARSALARPAARLVRRALGDRDRYPLATIWDIVPLFQSLDAIAIASPTPAHRRAVTRFATGAERYLNRGLRPVPGYSPYPGDRDAEHRDVVRRQRLVGAAFVNAYRATGSRRWLSDAERALRLRRRAPAGIRPRAGSGGTPSTPTRPARRSPRTRCWPTLLYQQTHSRFALAQARRFLAWANTIGLQRRRRPVRRQLAQPDPDRLHRGAADLRAGDARAG